MMSDSSDETVDEITFPSDDEGSQLPEYSNVPQAQQWRQDHELGQAEEQPGPGRECDQKQAQDQALWPGPPIIPLSVHSSSGHSSPLQENVAMPPMPPAGGAVSPVQPSESSSASPIFDLGQGSASSTATAARPHPQSLTPPEPPATRQKLQLAPRRGAPAAGAARASGMGGLHGSLGRLAKGSDGTRGFALVRSPRPSMATSSRQRPGEGPAARAAAPAQVSAKDSGVAAAAIGGELYLRVMVSQPELAGKITGMMLEHFTHTDLRALLGKRPEALELQVAEAVRLLQGDPATAAGTGCGEQTLGAAEPDVAENSASGSATASDGGGSRGGATPMDSDCDADSEPGPAVDAEVARLIEDEVAAQQPAAEEAGHRSVLAGWPAAERELLDTAARRVLQAELGAGGPVPQWLPAALVTIGRQRAAADPGCSRAEYLRHLYGVAPQAPAASVTPTSVPALVARRRRVELSAAAAGTGGSYSVMQRDDRAYVI